MAIFSVGDTVRLNSGGPLMTVKVEPHENVIYPVYVCQWFGDNDCLHEGSFPPASIHASRVKSAGI